MSEAKSYERGELTRRGNRLFEEQIRAKLPPGAEPHAFVAIDVETGDFELGESDVGAIDRLIERTPDAEGRICLRRVGSETTYRMGRRFSPESAASSSP